MNYSYILPRFLAQGSRPENHSRLYHVFDTVVLCAMEDQDIPLPGVEVIHVPLDDGPPPPRGDVAMAWQAAKTVAKRTRQGKRVLVTCHMGLNRSGLVTGLALRMLGYSSEQAVEAIRRARSWQAMRNPHFLELLAAVQTKRVA